MTVSTMRLLVDIFGPQLPVLETEEVTPFTA